MSPYPMAPCPDCGGSGTIEGRYGAYAPLTISKCPTCSEDEPVQSGPELVAANDRAELERFIASRRSFREYAREQMAMNLWIAPGRYVEALNYAQDAATQFLRERRYDLAAEEYEFMAALCADRHRS